MSRFKLQTASAYRSGVSMDDVPTAVQTVTVRIENGLHLGPSSQIVQLAQKHAVSIQISKGEHCVDGSSMLDLLTLAAEHGSQLRIQVSGVEAVEAMSALIGILDPTAVN